MIRHASECIKRAAECARLAEAESDIELKAYLMKLASSWTRAAEETVKLQDALRSPGSTALGQPCLDVAPMLIQVRVANHHDQGVDDQ